MASRFSTDKGGAGIAALLGLSLVAASMGGRIFVCGWAAFWAATLAWIAGRNQTDGGRVRKVMAAILSAGFPICVYFAGQSGVLLAAAAVPVILLSAYVIGGLKPEVALSVGESTLRVLLVGLGLSMVVAVASLSGGHVLILALLLILTLGSAPGLIWDSPPWQPFVAGLALSEIGAAVSLLFLGPPVTAGPMLFVGLLTALAAAAGRAWGTVTRIQPLVNAFLFASPSFYFGFKFFLT